ncbi:MAG: DoxX family protein [Myxococcota bacterium]
MNIMILGARLILGLIFFVFGLNGFLGFIEIPPLPEAAGAFLGALSATGYLFPLVKGLEVLAGLALLAGVFVPLSLLVLAPIVVNIVAFHAVLAPDGMFVPVLTLVLGIVVAWGYRSAFAPLFEPRRPTDTKDAPARTAAATAA